MTLYYVLAWLLPLAAGAGICLALERAPLAPGAIAAALGNGLLLGLLLTGTLVALTSGGDTSHAFQRTAPWLAVIAVISALVVFRRGVVASAWQRSAERASGVNGSSETPPRMSAWVWLWWLLLAAVVVRLFVLGSEAWLRPTFPWDAWSAWSVKPKTWFLLDHYIAYVEPSRWLAEPAIAQRTSAVWDYPESLAWVQVWFASAAGAWNEPLINLAWTAVLGAMVLLSYGQWRVLGIGAMLAIVLAYALVSLPLIGAHTALAGYADLWLAATFAAAVLAWLRWIRQHELAQLVLALLFALCLPMIKLEGAVWLFGFSLVVVFGLLPRRWRWRAAALVVLVAVIGIALGGFLLPLIGLGWVRVSWGQLVIPVLGALDLHWRPIGTAMLSGMLTLPNWHLLWYLVPVVLIWRRQVFARDRAAVALGVLLALCVMFLFVLFFFTDASAWAENYTSANRLLLHITPVVVTLMALLLADVSLRSRDTGREPPAPTDQG